MSNQIFADNVSYCDFLEVTFESTFDIPPMPQGWIYPINSMLQPIFDQFMAEVLITGVFDRINTTLLGGMPIKFIGNSFVIFYTKDLPL